MAMNFFQHQENARKRTALLVLLLVFATASLIFITLMVVAGFVYLLQNYSTSISAYNAYQATFTAHLHAMLLSRLSLWIAVAIIALVVIAALYKYLQLRAGGDVIAEKLGGKPLLPDSAISSERRLLNVVEEMAIASGCVVPSVYLLPDTSINAFAAGSHRHNAVLGITRGCMEKLSRDQLQGVIAHEFSHILNGDMTLNSRLVALLHGILIIGLTGELLVRSSTTRQHTTAASNNTSTRWGAGLLLVGIGYTGVLCGKIIRAAVCRQREFLADASAVQFTRNPQGIADALRKIGGDLHTSLLQSKHAATYSHFYFASGVGPTLSKLFATHPPLADRIQRITPEWRGDFLTSDAADVECEQTPPSEPLQRIQPAQFAASALAAMGAPTDAQVSLAKKRLAKITDKLRNAAREPFTARALIYALLLDKSTAVRKQQISLLTDSAHPATVKALRRLYPEVCQLARSQQLPLVELCMPALRQLSAPQYMVFKNNVEMLIASDGKTSLFEWCLSRILFANLESITRAKQQFNVKDVVDEISLLFSLVVAAGKSPSPGGAFQKGVEELNLRGAKFKLSDNFQLTEIDLAFNRLAQLKLLQKPRLLKSVAKIVSADGEITPSEAELFRAIADSLDCPVPPLSV